MRRLIALSACATPLVLASAASAGPAHRTVCRTRAYPSVITSLSESGTTCAVAEKVERYAAGSELAGPPFRIDGHLWHVSDESHAHGHTYFTIRSGSRIVYFTNRGEVS